MKYYSKLNQKLKLNKTKQNKTKKLLNLEQKDGVE
jgi:hypothetical protein